MSVKNRTIPFSTLKMSIRIVGYILFGIILLTAAINIFGILRNNDRFVRKIAEIMFQVLYPCVYYLVRMVLLVKSRLKQPGVVKIAGTMMPLFIFCIVCVICLSTALSIITLISGFIYPEGVTSIAYTFFPVFSLFIDRFVFADPENLYVGIRFIPANEIANVKIDNKNYKYAVKVDGKDGSKLSFGLSYKVEKERLMKFIEDHGINNIETPLIEHTDVPS